jgi:hypothetical protein
MASWISFWLDPNAAPARVTLAVTTMLTTFAHHKNVKDSLPPVAYTKVNNILNFFFQKIKNFKNLVKLMFFPGNRHLDRDVHGVRLLRPCRIRDRQCARA